MKWKKYLLSWHFVLVLALIFWGQIRDPRGTTVYMFI